LPKSFQEAEALNQMDAQNQCIKRAIDLSMKYDYLTKELPHSEQMAIENISAFGISVWIDMKEEPP
jgi:hypothetical protein